MTKLFLILILPLLLLQFRLSAQESIKGQNNFELKLALDKIAKTYSVQLYFRNEWITNIETQAPLKNIEVESAIADLLSQTDLSYIKISKNEFLIAPKEVTNYLNNSQSINTKIDKDKVLSDFVTIRGKIIDKISKNRIAGAKIQFVSIQRTAITDSTGRFQLTLPRGKYRILIQNYGYKDIQELVIADTSKELFWDMEMKIDILEEVKVFGKNSEQHIKSSEIGIVKINPLSIKKLPAFMGEVDVIKSILQQPGVTTVGEGSSGFFVRGGGVDQNLTLFDEAPIYNTAHMFGMFSIFQPDYIKDITLYKGGIPPRYGGRISSVLEVNSKAGNFKKYTGKGGISVLTNRLDIEGPILKDKISFHLSARTAFAGWIFKLLKNPSLRDTKANFSDLNLRLDYQLSPKNRITSSNYWGQDYLKLKSDSLSLLGIKGSETVFQYSNRFSTTKWDYNPSEKISLTTSLSYSDYRSKIINPSSNAFEINSGIENYIAKSMISYTIKGENKLISGIEGNLYSVNPGNLQAINQSTVLPINIQNEKGLETSFHILQQVQPIPRLLFSVGIRYSHYKYLGPNKVNIYSDINDRKLNTIIDTVSYTKNQNIQTYAGLEPRVALRYMLNEKNSIKINYNRTRQNLQLVSNTTSALPSDRWKLADNYILPQIGDQYAIGYFRNSTSRDWEFSWEMYYKEIQNFSDYRAGETLLLNKAIETAILQGKGKAYGAEWMLKKTQNKLTGLISYAYSKSLIQIEGSNENNTVNNGNWYPGNVDKPHQVNLNLAWQATKRWNLAMVFSYSTGRPITFPTAKYTVQGITLFDYENRNMQRIPDYHRLDISITFEPNLSKNKKWESTWNLSIINLYGRRNPFSVYFQTNGLNTEAYRLSLIGVPIPSLTYQFKF